MYFNVICKNLNIILSLRLLPPLYFESDFILSRLLVSIRAFINRLVFHKCIDNVLVIDDVCWVPFRYILCDERHFYLFSFRARVKYIRNIFRQHRFLFLWPIFDLFCLFVFIIYNLVISPPSDSPPPTIPHPIFPSHCLWEDASPPPGLPSSWGLKFVKD